MTFPFVPVGCVIYSDMGAMYECWHKFGQVIASVNHGKAFVDAYIKWLHSQNVERTWKSIRYEINPQVNNLGTNPDLKISEALWKIICKRYQLCFKSIVVDSIRKRCKSKVSLDMIKK